jgi:GT2 family glycosyltransferase
VDNGSSDGTVEYVRADFPRVHIVQSNRNLGFARGCNAGVQAADGEIIVLLNNDAVPRPHWLDSLVEPLALRGLRIVCSVVHDREYPEPYALGTGGLSLIGHPIPGAMRNPQQPFYATGGSLAFRKADFPVPFPPELFAYFEDALLSWLVRLRGGEIVRALDSQVDHLGSATARRMPTLRTYYYERNKLLLLLLVYEMPTLRLLGPLYAFDGLVRVFESLLQVLRGQSSAEAEVLRYRLIWRGLSWMALHASWLRAERRRVQRGRLLRDSAIIPLLSGRIFDDVIPSSLHRLANRGALAYCRLVGLRTVERQR